jgi:hypothetical protein
MDLFPYYLFIFILNHTHVIDRVSVVHLSFNQFAFQLVLVELTIQLHKSTTQSPFYLSFNFFPLTRFCSSSNRTMVLNVRIGFPSFVFSFLQEALDENVCNVEVFSRLGDVHMVFGIYFFNDLPKGHLLGFFSPLRFILLELAFYELTFIQNFNMFSSLSSFKFLHPVLLVYQ